MDVSRLLGRPLSELALHESLVARLGLFVRGIEVT
jgi:hypothetical protein